MPLSSTIPRLLAHLVHFLLALALVLPLILLAGVPLTPQVLWLPSLILFQTAFLLGLGLLRGDRAGIREASADGVLAVEGLDGPAVGARRGLGGRLGCGCGGGGLCREGRPSCQGATADRRCEEEHRGHAALSTALEMRVGSHAATVEGGRNGSLSAD